MLNIALVALVMLAPQGAHKVKPAHNKTCPGCGGAVDAKSPTLAVRGQSYRFCCPDCGAMVQKNPDKFLEKDGTPRNAKR